MMLWRWLTMPICVVKPLPQDDTSGMAEGSAYWGMSLALFQFFFYHGQHSLFPNWINTCRDETVPCGVFLCNSFPGVDNDRDVLQWSFQGVFEVFFFRLPTEWKSSPYRSRFGMQLFGIHSTWPAHLICALRAWVQMLSALVQHRIAVSGIPSCHLSWAPCIGWRWKSLSHLSLSCLL